MPKQTYRKIYLSALALVLALLAVSGLSTRALKSSADKPLPYHSGPHNNGPYNSGPYNSGPVRSVPVRNTRAPLIHVFNRVRTGEPVHTLGGLHTYEPGRKTSSPAQQIAVRQRGLALPALLALAISKRAPASAKHRRLSERQNQPGRQGQAGSPQLTQKPASVPTPVPLPVPLPVPNGATAAVSPLSTGY